MISTKMWERKPRLAHYIQLLLAFIKHKKRHLIEEAEKSALHLMPFIYLLFANFC